MNKTFYKNNLSGMNLVANVIMAIACVIFGIVYTGDSMLKIAVPVIGIVFIVIGMVYAYNKNEMYKRVRLTEEYIEVVSNFRIGYKIEFSEVEAVGKIGMAHTKSSYEKFFISTMPISHGGEIDLSNTITFDATAKSKQAMEYLADKYGWEIVEI